MNLPKRFATLLETSSLAPALIYPNESVSYVELDSLSNQFVGFLEKEDIHKGDVVAIFNDKSKYGYALILACLKKGVLYTHLDHDSPTTRILAILNTAQPKAVISFFDLNLDGFSKWKTIRFSPKLLSSASFEKSYLEALSADHPAYIMFTSGSTGQPKGAVIIHSSLLNFVSWAKDTYQVIPADRFTAVNPIYFDNSVFDFYASIFNGSALIPVSPELNAKPAELVEALEKTKPTIWFSVPSFLIYLMTTRALKKDKLRSVRAFIFGGEGFPKPRLKKLFDDHSSHAGLFNVYGPTECTCICSSYQIGESDFSDMLQLAPLGKMARDFDFRIVDDSFKDCDEGELVLYGPNVGIGYYNDPQRTAKTFDFSENQKGGHKRSYRTGDLVQIQDGLIYFKGRKDFQIKHMGYRIELEEIEANISALDGVNENAVIYQKQEMGGKIVAFLSMNKDRTENSVLDELRTKIPNYMMPKQIVFMESLPKNPNGKIDRVKLKETLK